MTTRYQELFRIRCRHAYFAGQRCPLLELRPTRECTRLLDRYDCLFRAAAGEGVVYYAAGGDSTLLRLFDENAPFAFALATTGPELDHCTESARRAAVGPADGIYYFSNRNHETGIVSGAEQLLLHPAGRALPDGRLPVRPAQFACTFANPVTGTDLSLLDALGNPVEWKADAVPAGKSSTLLLDFGNLSPGRYQLAANGNKAYDFYLSNAGAAKNWGIAEIFPGGRLQAGNLPPACRLIDAAGVIAPGISFTIFLDARMSFWRYIVIGQSASKRAYEDYRVVASTPRGAKEASPALEFTAPVRGSVGGKDCWVFESTTAVSLCEVPRDRYEIALQSNHRPADGVSSFPLPYARAEDTMQEETKDGIRRTWSEIYVNL